MKVEKNSVRQMK